MRSSAQVPWAKLGSDGPDTTYDGACMGFASAVGALQHACCKLGGMEESV